MWHIFPSNQGIDLFDYFVRHEYLIIFISKIIPEDVIPLSLWF